MLYNKTQGIYRSYFAGARLTKYGKGIYVYMDNNPILYDYFLLGAFFDGLVDISFKEFYRKLIRDQNVFIKNLQPLIVSQGKWEYRVKEWNYNDNSGFSKLQFSGTTVSFPALKR